MPTPFDQYAQQAFTQVALALGRDATWVSPLGDTYKAKVMFEIPPSNANLGGMDIEYDGPRFDYQDAQLPGLFAFVTEGLHQTVVIDGISYRCTNVVRHKDGQELRAYLSEIRAGSLLETDYLDDGEIT